MGSIGDCYNNPTSSRSGHGCKSNCSTARSGTPASSSPTRRSTTSRSGTTANAVTASPASSPQQRSNATASTPSHANPRKRDYVKTGTHQHRRLRLHGQSDPVRPSPTQSDPVRPSPTQSDPLRESDRAAASVGCIAEAIEHTPVGVGIIRSARRALSQLSLRALRTTPSLSGQSVPVCSGGQGLM